jgi:hypothetical protein
MDLALISTRLTPYRTHENIVTATVTKLLIRYQHILTILVNKRAGSLSSLSLVGLIDSVELSSQAELAEGAELTT